VFENIIIMTKESGGTSFLSGWRVEYRQDILTSDTYE